MLRVNGCRRVPDPPARMMPLIIAGDCIPARRPLGRAALAVRSAKEPGGRDPSDIIASEHAGHGERQSDHRVSERHRAGPGPSSRHRSGRARHRDARRPAIGQDGAASRRRPPGIRVLHQLHEPEGTRARCQSPGLALLLLADARRADSDRRARRTAAVRRVGCATSRAVRAAASSARGPRRKARCCRRAKCWRKSTARSKHASRIKPSRARRSGAASASSLAHRVLVRPPRSPARPSRLHTRGRWLADRTAVSVARGPQFAARGSRFATRGSVARLLGGSVVRLLSCRSFGCSVVRLLGLGCSILEAEHELPSYPSNDLPNKTIYRLPSYRSTELR